MIAHQGILNRTIKWDQIKEAFCDLQVWLLFIYVFLNEFVNGGFANFGKLIIKGIVKTPLLTVAYGIPQGAFQVFFIVSGAYLATKFRNLRTYIMVLYLFPTIVGLSLIWKLPRDNHIGLLFGYYIVSPSSNPVKLEWERGTNINFPRPAPTSPPSSSPSKCPQPTSAATQSA